MLTMCWFVISGEQLAKMTFFALHSRTICTYKAILSESLISGSNGGIKSHTISREVVL